MRVQAAVTRRFTILVVLGLLATAGCSTEHQAPSVARVGGRVHLVGTLRDNAGNVTGTAVLDATDSAVVTLWRHGVPEQRVRTYRGGYEFYADPGDGLRVGWGDAGDSAWCSTPHFTLARSEVRDLADLEVPGTASFPRSAMVYPNPARSGAACGFQLATGGSFQFLIETLSGRVAYSMGFSTGSGGTITVHFPLGAGGINLATGDYWVRVLHDGRDAVAPALLFVGYLPGSASRPAAALEASRTGSVPAPPVFEWRAQP